MGHQLLALAAIRAMGNIDARFFCMHFTCFSPAAYIAAHPKYYKVTLLHASES